MDRRRRESYGQSRENWTVQSLLLRPLTAAASSPDEPIAAFTRRGKLQLFLLHVGGPIRQPSPGRCRAASPKISASAMPSSAARRSTLDTTRSGVNIATGCDSELGILFWSELAGSCVQTSILLPSPKVWAPWLERKTSRRSRAGEKAFHGRNVREWREAQCGQSCVARVAA